MRTYDDGACGMCDGSGHSTLMVSSHRRCLYCNGSGIAPDILYYGLIFLLEFLGLE